VNHLVYGKGPKRFSEKNVLWLIMVEQEFEYMFFI
jgi:hypothetical protein